MNQIKTLLVFGFILISNSASVVAQDSTTGLAQLGSLTALNVSEKEAISGVVSKSKVSVNLQESLNISRAHGEHNAIHEVNLAAEEGFLVQLPGGTEVTLNTDRSHSYVDGIETFSGRVEDLKNGYFTLSVANEKVIGQIKIGPMIYDISYDKAEQSHVLTEIDQAKMPHHSPEPLGDASVYKAAIKSNKALKAKAALQSPGGPSPMLTSPDIGTIRVLVLHGSDVANPSYLTSNIISSMNNTFFDDGMDPDLHFTLADLRNLGDDLEDVCKFDIADDMVAEDAPFEDIATWVDDEDADIVLTVVTADASLTGCPTLDKGRVGGIAADWLNSSKPYAVTMDTYAISDLTAIHEVGHVLGGFHPESNDATLQYWSPDSELYARGFFDPLNPLNPSDESEWQTVMGAYGQNDCDFSTSLPNTDCVRLPLWSNPNKTYGGEARGEAFTAENQDPYSADMASALEVHMPIVAEWQSYPYSAPGTPSNIDVEECFNKNFVSWDATTNAENYQMLFSYSSSFTNPEVMYFGSSTMKMVVVPQYSTKYVKIRACNGSGCGAYSSQLTLTYNNYCN